MNNLKNIFLFLIGFVVVVGSVYLVYQQRIGVSALPVLVSENATTTSAHIEMTYPKSSKTLYPEVFDFVTKIKNEFDAKYANVTVDDLKSEYGRTDVVFELYMNTKIATSTKTTSFIIETYEYTGGAHGGTSVTTFTYDSSGKLVTIESLLGDKYLDTVSPLAKKYFYDKLGDSSQPFMIDDGTAPRNDNFSSWYLTNDSVVFIFGQYQVGPYVLGIQEFPIGKTLLEGIINPKFK